MVPVVLMGPRRLAAVLKAKDGDKPALEALVRRFRAHAQKSSGRRAKVWAAFERAAAGVLHDDAHEAAAGLRAAPRAAGRPSFDD